ncbi:exocyst complex component 3-like protein 4 [Stegastes partitus]|uniref:Exocyst complex component 3-like protein 4 n=1 Tax=Stegastes partitus TaxID=144197 RepID=A0A9Y4JKM0_9TELE|nr:PREDICTED: exocyst complex component 3-like protein 4 [Stegastes partitus]
MSDMTDDAPGGNPFEDNVADDGPGGNPFEDNVVDDSPDGNPFKDNVADDGPGGNPFEDNVADDGPGGNPFEDNVTDDAPGGNPFDDNEADDGPGGNPVEDNVSLKSNGKTSTNGDVKKKQPGILKSFRSSIRRVAAKSQISPRVKGPKGTPKKDATGKEVASSPPPPSPSLSSGSPVTSPLKNIGTLFQRKEEDENEKQKTLPRSKTDPNMSRLGDSFLRKGEKLRQSLRLTSKKDNDKASKQKPLGLVPEGSLAEKKEKEEEEEEEAKEEMEETYELPEIPHAPLSVMQINKLIEMEVLEEAHLNLLSLRQEFQQEQQQYAEDLSVELAKKEKDLNLLYGELRKKICHIVRDSNSLPSRNKALLVPVARIIQEEDRRAEDRRAEEPGRLPDTWMEAWREAVGEGVKAKVQSVHLEKREQNASWLAVHLGLLGKTIVEDLENVKKELRWSYPPSFKVFSTYVRSYHQVVGQHLKKLEIQVTELKDLYALLDWIINRYKSERIMGSLSLQPDMQAESSDVQLEEEFLKQLKEKYCSRVKMDFCERGLSTRRQQSSVFSHLLCLSPQKVKSNGINSRKIDAQLEVKVISSCLEELKQFPDKFESEFRRHCSALRPQPLWTEYHITYINSFACLQQHMESYQDTCPGEVEGFKKEVKGLNVRLMQSLEDQFKDDVKPYLRRMMTRKWLTNDEDFEQLYRRTEQLSQHCALMRPPHVQTFTSRLHLHVVKEYVGQLMKGNYSCKNRKHEKAAAKIRHQWNQLRDLFEDMESPHEWLHSVGDDLSSIIEQKNKTDIKNHLQPLVEHYPDISRKHLVAVLYFRGLLRGREHQRILQRLAALKKELNVDSSDKSRLLFGDMQVTVNTDCLSTVPSCFSFLPSSN